MITANEILESKEYFTSYNSILTEGERLQIIEAMIDYATQAIKECADCAVSLPGSNWESYGPVDKTSILDVIEELK